MQSLDEWFLRRCLPVCGAPGRGRCMISPEIGRLRARKEMQSWQVILERDHQELEGKL